MRQLAVKHLYLHNILGGPVDLSVSMYECFNGELEGSWDNQLTENELNFMCGMYRIFTGEH